MWKAGVKSFKVHLKSVISMKQFSYEEFNTAIVQIEGILNSRSLTQKSTDPLDFTYLTPTQFLIGALIPIFSEPDILNISENRL